MDVEICVLHTELRRDNTLLPNSLNVCTLDRTALQIRPFHRDQIRCIQTFWCNVLSCFGKLFTVNEELWETVYSVKRLCLAEDYEEPKEWLISPKLWWWLMMLMMMFDDDDNDDDENDLSVVPRGFLKPHSLCSFLFLYVAIFRDLTP